MYKWWLEKPMRLIQTNLREIDANLDVEKLISSLKEFSADVLLVNVGGIVANYATSLDFHYRNPHAPDDFVEKIVKRAHQEGIRVIARFDFSKVNEVYLEKHPEWLYKSVAGNHVTYNGQVHTCVNSAYQQECSIRILEEVIDRYPVDGVFFNMIGYVTRDYSGNYHGICQCDSCKTRFMDMYGHTSLPVKEDGNDPLFRDYEKFRVQTCKELFNNITSAVKRKNENVAICTYTHEGVDIYRKESNTALDRELPEWNYSASDNVKSVFGSWDNMVVSNSAVHFVDFPFRHSSVSPELTALRLAEDIANGGWLDYFVIGSLDNQDDRLCFNTVKDLFRFHKKNEEFYTGTKSAADVCLVVPENSRFYGSLKEYKGLFRILAQSHVLFDAMHDSILNSSEALDKLKKYQVVVLPDTRNMSEQAAATIDRYVREGGKVLATGASSTCDVKGNPLGRVNMECAGIASVERLIEKESGTYFRVRQEDKGDLKGFEDLDIIYLNDELMECSLIESARGLLGYMPACMFGPPEKCYYTVETDIPGVILNNYQMGKCAYIPWRLGRHYEKLSNHAQYMLFMSVLEGLLGYDRSLSIQASPMVEVVSHIQKENKWQLVNLVNLSGQLGTAFLSPLKIQEIKVSVKTGSKPSKIFTLWNKRELEYIFNDNGFVEFTVPELELLETIVIDKSIEKSAK